jgi:hypothetical protein
MTADRNRGRPARDITWTTKPPASRRRGPEDIMSKPEQLSAAAQAASTEGDLWSLFFTSEILQEIVDNTNVKIEEDYLQQDYSNDRMNKSPYITTTDMVIFMPHIH